MAKSDFWLSVYSVVTDIVRPIREIVQRGEETVGHSVRPKCMELRLIVCPTRVHWSPGQVELRLIVCPIRVYWCPTKL